MKTEKKTGETSLARGKKFDPPVTYDYEWTTYENIDELRAAKDELTDDEQVKVRNNERQMKSRGAAQNKKLDEMGIVKPTAENDEQVRLRDMFKTLMTAKVNGSPKYTAEQARAVASDLVGVEWAE